MGVQKVFHSGFFQNIGVNINPFRENIFFRHGFLLFYPNKNADRILNEHFFPDKLAAWLQICW